MPKSSKDVGNQMYIISRNVIFAKLCEKGNNEQRNKACK